MAEDWSVGRVSSSLNQIPATENDSGGSVEQKRPEDTAIAEPDLETEMSSIVEIGRRINHLRLCQIHSCKACLSDFSDILSRIRKYRGSATQKLLEIGFLEIFQQVLRAYYNKTVTVEGEISVKSSMYAIIYTCSTVAIMTDVSSVACRKVIHLELHIDIIISLRNGSLDPRQIHQSPDSDLFDLVYYLMLVLYNVVQLAAEARELYREQDIIEVIQRFRIGTSNLLSCLALMLLAWVISDEENSIINSNDEDFSLLNQELKSSLDEVPHRSKQRYKAVELLAAMNKLVVNDANKQRFVKSGGLSSYVAFLEPHFDAEEQFLAAQGLWILAFKCAEEIKKEKTCLESKQCPNRIGLLDIHVDLHIYT